MGWGDGETSFGWFVFCDFVDTTKLELIEVWEWRDAVDRVDGRVELINDDSLHGGYHRASAYWSLPRSGDESAIRTVRTERHGITPSAVAHAQVAHIGARIQ